MNKFTVVLAVCLLFLGCSSENSDFLTLPDAATQLSDASTYFPSACVDSAVAYDFDNCGACGNSCSLDDADRCVGGECLCGSAPACAPGSNCYAGLCIVADPEGSRCEFSHQCPVAHACIEGFCTSVDCQAEICDGVDNDCDGEVDEASAGVPLTALCGPTTTEGPCRRGYEVCVDGLWSACQDAVWPVDEAGLLACDGIDNDCDGCVDGFIREDGLCERREAASFDVVFILDVSGSMSDVIDEVKAASASFSSMFATDRFRYAIVTAGSFSPSTAAPELLLDLSSYSTFDAALDTVSASGGAYEPTWDSPYAVATDSLGITWREGSARIIVQFTDEEGQTYTVPGTTEADMCSSAASGELFVFFSSSVHRGDYDDCGLWFDVRDRPNLVPNLVSVIGDPCT